MQENRVAAFLSRDEVMLKAFNSPEQLTKDFTIIETVNDVAREVVKSITYNNPDTDLHTQTAMETYTDVFRDVAEYKIIEVASNTARDGMIIRKSGKITNFSLIFGTSAQALAELNFIKLKIAESWVAAHKSKYKGFHKWADNVGRIASYRGWTNTQLGRCRWVKVCPLMQ